MSSKFYRSQDASFNEISSVQSKITSLQSLTRLLNPLICLQGETVIYPFDERLVLDFSQYSQYSDIKIDSGKRLSFLNSTAKIKISIRLVYNWKDKDYAPRFMYNLLVNDVLVLADGSDVNDSSEEGVKNVSNVVFIHDFNKEDKVQIILTKTSSSDEIILFKNSHIEFNYF